MVARRFARPVVAGALLLLGTDGAALARRQSTPPVLDKIERGQWQLSERDGSGRRVCFATPTDFIQLEHGAAQCEVVTEAADARSATIRYTCTGHGKGRTMITVETPRLVKIETQGVADSAPFQREYEARKTGATCG